MRNEACLKVGNGERMNLGKWLEFAGDIQERVLLLAKSWYRDKRVFHFARGPAGKGALRVTFGVLQTPCLVERNMNHTA